MLQLSILFLVIALASGALGFSGIAGAAAGIAKVLFGFFLLGFIVAVALAFTAAKKIRSKL